jgi:hypothetical protein
MVLGKIPPHHFYGFRTRKTLSNPEVWYRANRLAGIDLIVASRASLFASALVIPLLPEQVAVSASGPAVRHRSDAGNRPWFLANSKVVALDCLAARRNSNRKPGFSLRRRLIPWQQATAVPVRVRHAHRPVRPRGGAPVQHAEPRLQRHAHAHVAPLLRRVHAAPRPLAPVVPLLAAHASTEQRRNRWWPRKCAR